MENDSDDGGSYESLEVVPEEHDRPEVNVGGRGDADGEVEEADNWGKLEKEMEELYSFRSKVQISCFFNRLITSHTEQLEDLQRFQTALFPTTEEEHNKSEMIAIEMGQEALLQGVKGVMPLYQPLRPKFDPIPKVEFIEALNNKLRRFYQRFDVKVEEDEENWREMNRRA